MKKILVTGGTVFVSRFIAEYFVEKGNEVYVLNRNHHTQVKHTILIETGGNMEPIKLWGKSLSSKRVISPIDTARKRLKRIL